MSKVGAHNITAQQGGMTVDPADVYYTQVQPILYSHPPNYLSRNCELAMNPCQPSVTEVAVCRELLEAKSLLLPIFPE